MIIFTPIQNIIEYLEGYFGTAHNYYEFNYSCPIERGLSISSLNPLNLIDSFIPADTVNEILGTEEFDMKYLQNILNDRNRFFALMNIMLPIFQDENPCVIIYTSGDYFRDIGLQNLIKVITNRYGYKPYTINEELDIEYIKEFANNFTPSGIVTMQDDCQQATVMGYYGPIPMPNE